MVTETQSHIINALQSGDINISNLSKANSEEVLKVLVELSIKKARIDFYTYVKVMADELIPTGFVDGNHLKLISNHLMEVEQSIRDAYEKKRKYALRKQFFLPPGAMKSLLISVLFVTWFLGRNPKFRVLQLGYSTDFAIDNFGRKVKDILATSERFKMIFPICSLRPDTRSSQRFETTLGGGYYCVGATGGIAGRRAHLLICDDVINEQTAFSDTERTKIVRWYIPGARSRLLGISSEIVVNTRWHVDDLSAYLLKVDNVPNARNPWEVISIPAILDKESARMLGLKENHSFWPELYSDDYLLMQKDSYINSGEAARWSALYMQNPVPEEGNIVKRDYIKYWENDDPPPLDYVVVSVDTAFETTKRADFTAITVWGIFRKSRSGYNGFNYIQNNVILLDAVHGKWELQDLIDELKVINEEYKPDWFIIEKKASGISVLQELRRNPEFPLYEYVPDRDKMARLQSALPTMRAGCVWFPQSKEYALDVITELLQFPAGKHDDYVDTVSMVINWMRLNLLLARPGESGWDNDEEDEEQTYKGRPNSYWGALQG
jgi:predicted phage terminase large subunit-like protein